MFTFLTSSGKELPVMLLPATLSPMMGAVIASIIKAYLSGAAVGGRRLGILGILTALWQFGALPGETQKSLLLAVLRNSASVGVVSSVISVTTVGGFHEITEPGSPFNGREPPFSGPQSSPPSS